MQISKLKKVPLREIWEKEAKDFTSWFEKNIDSLNEQLDLKLTVTEREKKIGDFFLDIEAEDEEGNLVVIENQLEETNHDHLGKILTYLNGLEAKKAIWICAKPRPEHKKAIDWLNEIAPPDVSFYLVQVEAVRIEDSPPAPLFTLITGPTKLGKKVGHEKRKLKEKHYLRKEFWLQLLEKAQLKTSLHENITPRYDHWISAGAGKAGISYVYLIFKDRGAVEVYFDKGKGSDKINKQRFDALFKHKKEIEKTFGKKLIWQRLDTKRASRIRYNILGIGLRNKERWPELQNKMIDAMIRLEKACAPYINKLVK